MPSNPLLYVLELLQGLPGSVALQIPFHTPPVLPQPAPALDALPAGLLSSRSFALAGPHLTPLPQSGEAPSYFQPFFRTDLHTSTYVQIHLQIHNFTSSN